MQVTLSLENSGFVQSSLCWLNIDNMNQGEPIPGATPSEITKQRDQSFEPSETSVVSSLNIKRVIAELFDSRLISREKDVDGRRETASAVTAVRKIDYAKHKTSELVLNVIWSLIPLKNSHQ